VLYGRLWREYRDVRKLSDQQAGLIASAIYNVNMGKDQTPLTPADLYPQLAPPVSKQPRTAKEAKRWMHENADQSIGNDFFDFGGGNSRSRSVRSSFVNLISRGPALSRRCASVLAFGIAITSGWRNTHASAIWAGVVSWDARSS